MKKKSIGGKSVKRKNKQAAKPASKMSVGDLIFEKNLDNVLKEREGVMEDIVPAVLKTVPDMMQQMEKMGIKISADSSAGIAAGMIPWSMLSEHLCILTAEMRTIRQMLELGVKSETILRRLEEKLR